MLQNGLSTPLPSQHDVITQVYDIFFELAPAGQEYFKQSATRALDLGPSRWMVIDRNDGLGLGRAIQKPEGSKVHVLGSINSQ